MGGLNLGGTWKVTGPKAIASACWRQTGQIQAVCQWTPRLRLMGPLTQKCPRGTGEHSTAVQLFTGACCALCFPSTSTFQRVFAFCTNCISGLRDQLSAWFPSKSKESSRFREGNSSVSFYQKRQGSRRGPAPLWAARQLRSPHQHYTVAKTLSVVTLSCLPLLELTRGPRLLAEPFTTLGTDLTIRHLTIAGNDTTNDCSQW